MRKTLLDAYNIADARQIKDILPEKPFVDVTITSPPYWNLKDYGSRNQMGFGQEYEEYLNDLEGVFTSVYEITKKTGSLWVVADTIKHNGQLKLFPFDLAQRLRNVGWSLHDIIIWNKDKTLPWSHRGKLRNIFEYILFFSKGKKFKYYLHQVREIDGMKEWWMRYPERYSPQGKAPTRTWSIPIPRQGSWGYNWVRHFCPFPPELVRRIILLTTKRGAVVLDPFAGSGVVLAQAKALGRHYAGIDLRKSYRRMFKTKVLPSVTRLEAHNSDARVKKEKRRKTFSGLIWRLRKTKYPRELVRLYKKKYGRPQISGIIAISPSPTRLNVTFVCPSPGRPSRVFLSRMRKLMHRPPLSKYGLRVKLITASLPKSQEKLGPIAGLRPTARLSLYENGKTYHFTKDISLKEFASTLGNSLRQQPVKVPLIASNVRVRVSGKLIAQLER